MLFVSDVHLLTAGSARAGERARAWGEFLDAAAARAAAGGLAALYVLGDLFDYWFEARGRIPRGFRAECERIRGAVARGLRVVVLPGNRDFLLGAAFRQASGAETAPAGLAVVAGGLRLHLTHGDALTLADRRYQLWRRLSRGAAFARAARGMPAAAAEVLARVLRGGSELEKRAKARSVMGYSQRAIEKRVAAGADAILAGHVHEPGEREVRAGTRTVKFIALGAWDAGPGAYAEFDGRTLRLVR